LDAKNQRESKEIEDYAMWQEEKEEGQGQEG
jgi:hypothetical protein